LLRCPEYFSYDRHRILLLDRSDLCRRLRSDQPQRSSEASPAVTTSLTFLTADDASLFQMSRSNPAWARLTPRHAVFRTIGASQVRSRFTNRTSFAPETTSTKRNERDQTQTKKQQNQRSRSISCRILPLITVWLQVRVLPGPPVFSRRAWPARSRFVFSSTNETTNPTFLLGAECVPIAFAAVRRAGRVVMTIGFAKRHFAHTQEARGFPHRCRSLHQPSCGGIAGR
jgi:hypothetical protein